MERFKAENTQGWRLSWAVRRAGGGGCISGRPHGKVNYYVYTRKLVRIMSLPLTDLNIFVHLNLVHLRVLLWKAADQPAPLDVSISEYGRAIKDGILCPNIDISNGSCHRVQLSCTNY